MPRQNNDQRLAKSLSKRLSAKGITIGYNELLIEIREAYADVHKKPSQAQPVLVDPPQSEDLLIPLKDGVTAVVDDLSLTATKEDVIIYRGSTKTSPYADSITPAAMLTALVTKYPNTAIHDLMVEVGWHHLPISAAQFSTTLWDLIKADIIHLDLSRRLSTSGDSINYKPFIITPAHYDHSEESRLPFWLLENLRTYGFVVGCSLNDCDAAYHLTENGPTLSELVSQLPAKQKEARLLPPLS